MTISAKVGLTIQRIEYGGSFNFVAFSNAVSILGLKGCSVISATDGVGGWLVDVRVYGDVRRFFGSKLFEQYFNQYIKALHCYQFATLDCFAVKFANGNVAQQFIDFISLQVAMSVAIDIRDFGRVGLIEWEGLVLAKCVVYDDIESYSPVSLVYSIEMAANKYFNMTMVSHYQLNNNNFNPIVDGRYAYKCGGLPYDIAWRVFLGVLQESVNMKMKLLQ